MYLCYVYIAQLHRAVCGVYSFGVVLWELVTGEQPKRGQLRSIRCVSDRLLHAHHAIGHVKLGLCMVSLRFCLIQLIFKVRWPLHPVRTLFRSVCASCTRACAQTALLLAAISCILARMFCCILDDVASSGG